MLADCLKDDFIPYVGIQGFWPIALMRALVVMFPLTDTWAQMSSNDYLKSGCLRKLRADRCHDSSVGDGLSDRWIVADCPVSDLNPEKRFLKAARHSDCSGCVCAGDRALDWWMVADYLNDDFSMDTEIEALDDC